MSFFVLCVVVACTYYIVVRNSEYRNRNQNREARLFAAWLGPLGLIPRTNHANGRDSGSSSSDSEVEVVEGASPSDAAASESDHELEYDDSYDRMKTSLSTRLLLRMTHIAAMPMAHGETVTFLIGQAGGAALLCGVSPSIRV